MVCTLCDPRVRGRLHSRGAALVGQGVGFAVVRVRSEGG